MEVSSIFTGLVEEKGVIEKISKGTASYKLYIKANKIFSDLKIGDSVAVNGICLTATSVNYPVFSIDVMHETIRRSSLSDLTSGSYVNLERAMPANGRFGGHIVSGHVDGIGVISAFKKDDIAVWITIDAKPEIMKYIVEKGSVTLDGVSLTVADISQKNFSVSIIPHTAEETILLSKKKGDKINIECDIIGKYVEKLLGLNKSESKITKEFLFENGFF